MYRFCFSVSHPFFYSLCLFLLILESSVFSKTISPTYETIPMNRFFEGVDLIYGVESGNRWDWNFVMQSSCNSVAENITKQIVDLGPIAKQRDRFGNRYGTVLEGIRLNLLNDCHRIAMHRQFENQKVALLKIKRYLNTRGNLQVEYYSRYLLDNCTPPFYDIVVDHLEFTPPFSKITFNSYVSFILRFDHEVDLGNFDNAARMMIALHRQFGSHLGSLFTSTARRVGDQNSFLIAFKNIANSEYQNSGSTAMSQLIIDLNQMIASLKPDENVNERIVSSSPTEANTPIPVAQNISNYNLQP